MVFDAFFLFILGLLAGTYGAMIGAGGGFLAVPFLLLLFHFPSELAVGTSLVMVLFNALSSTVAFMRQKRIDIKLGTGFALATVPGAILGAFILETYGSPVFRSLFGGLLIVISIYLMVRKSELSPKDFQRGEERVLVDSKGEVFRYRADVGLGYAISFGIGFLSSFFGIGGGIVQAPLMILSVGFPAHIAVATSQFILTVTSLLGSLSHLYLGNILIEAAIPLAAGAVIGAQVGARMTRRIRGTTIRRLLTVGLALVGIRLLLQG